jgi:hypothetical protein
MSRLGFEVVEELFTAAGPRRHPSSPVCGNEYVLDDKHRVDGMLALKKSWASAEKKDALVISLTTDLLEEAFSALRVDPTQFATELRFAAASRPPFCSTACWPSLKRLRLDVLGALLNKGKTLSHRLAEANRVYSRDESFQGHNSGASS